MFTEDNQKHILFVVVVNEKDNLSNIEVDIIQFVCNNIDKRY